MRSYTFPGELCIVGVMTHPEFKRIIVTTDLSDESIRAYPYARTLARSHNGKITVLTCIDTSIQLGVGGSMEMPVMYVPETLAAIKERAISELNTHIQTHFSEETANCVVREAAVPVHHMISEFIKETGFDLVIMSSHGRSGFRRALIGSVTEQVVRASTTPVLVVPVRSS